MKKVNLVIFNEPYWDKGLIYTQNILPLIELTKGTDIPLNIVSFTSLPFLIMKYKAIRKAKKEFKQSGVSVTDFPVMFYPTRYMLLRWLLIPFYYLNVYIYIKWLNKKDREDQSTNIYSVRSYQAALGFLSFFHDKNKIVFDTRTDWIEENINVGNFKEKSRTVTFWRKKEKLMLQTFKKTLFISPVFRHNVLLRNGMELDDTKYLVVYNPIDYKHFESIKNNDTNNNFLYTGSLGHWNNISIYLDFFKQVAFMMPSSKLIVCTSSPAHKIIPILQKPKYNSIRDRVELHFNVPYSELPEYYAQCTFGLQLMSKKDSRVGVKFIEYIASGLVPIVNENVMGAVALARKFNIGIVLNNNSDADIIEKIEKAKRKITEENLNAFREITDLRQIKKILTPIYLK